ncbi:hypothetical protein OIE75_33360 [Streptomyces sp. NBC_01723]|nr:hypothetical protein [Streptomyces sp. NBC_01723]
MRAVLETRRKAAAVRVDELEAELKRVRADLADAEEVLKLRTIGLEQYRRGALTGRRHFLSFHAVFAVIHLLITQNGHPTMTSTPPPPISEPDPSTFTTSSSYVEACAGCQRPTHRYGSGGLPLCQWYLAPEQKHWGPAVRFTNTRPHS